MKTIYFAAGCFWGVQYYFDQVPGVVETEVGYMGGHTEHPTYEQVCSHTTGHAETVKVVFNPAEVSNETLVRQFFRMHDPTQLNRQGPDMGDNYRSAIFYTSEQQKTVAEQIIRELNLAKIEGGIVTELIAAGAWWPAEAYHQKYAERTGRGTCPIAYAPLESPK
jgi:peptide methionine sulfoxide reductase msrA/msrB